MTNFEIGRRLAITEATVAKHLEYIYAHTGARNRAEAVSMCQDLRPAT